MIWRSLLIYLLDFWWVLKLDTVVLARLTVKLRALSRIVFSTKEDLLVVGRVGKKKKKKNQIFEEHFLSLLALFVPFGVLV